MLYFKKFVDSKQTRDIPVLNSMDLSGHSRKLNGIEIKSQKSIIPC
jgi:hypothetical protein